MSYLQLLGLAAPETIVVLTALAVLIADLVALRGLEVRLRLLIGGMISCVGCVAAIAWMAALPQQANFANGMLVVEPLTQFVKIALLVLTLFTVALSVETDFTTHVGEYFAVVLFAAVGMMLLVSSEDILMVFLSLELTSLSLYILTAFNKRNLKSSEAALKYFLFGGVAAAFTLFGLSWLYGLTGATNLGEIARVVAERAVHVVSRPDGTVVLAPDGTVVRALDPLLVGAIVMTLIGFGFKIAAVPFHLWAPDAYEGAPTPSAALIASGSKAASFFIFARVMMLGFAGVEGSSAWGAYAQGWVPAIAVVAAASMVLGNLAALAQNSVRRLLAYSAIAHAGYMLLGVMSHNGPGLAALMYYVITYGLTTVGAFGIVGIVQQQTGGDRLSNFAGLGRTAPVVSLCLMVFMLSLAGIPPLAGFFGKFYLFSATIGVNGGLGLLWLVSLAIGMSAVSLYYYLQVLKQAYIVESPAVDRVKPVPALTEVVVVLLALAVLVLGCAPGLLLEPLGAAVKAAGL